MARRSTAPPAPQPSFFDALPKKLERDPNVASKWDVSEKNNPDIVFAKRDWDLPGKMGVLPEGSKFVECNDSFYNVYYPGGDKAHYRLQKKIIYDIINKA